MQPIQQNNKQIYNKYLSNHLKKESVIWKTMESFLLKTKECLYKTRQFEEKVAILKQKDDEFFVKEEVAMLKCIHDHLKRVSAILFSTKSSPEAALNWKFSGPAVIGGGVSLRQLTPRILRLLRVFPAPR
jgi:hypothetical protein